MLGLMRQTSTRVSSQSSSHSPPRSLTSLAFKLCGFISIWPVLIDRLQSLALHKFQNFLKDTVAYLIYGKQTFRYGHKGTLIPKVLVHCEAFDGSIDKDASRELQGLVPGLLWFIFGLFSALYSFPTCTDPRFAISQANYVIIIYS
jgi:hypothetical protein